MYNCWNEAVKYLGDKYGTRKSYTVKFAKRVALCTSRAKRKELEAQATDRDIIKAMPNMNDAKGLTLDDAEVYMLLGQYNYGIAPKKELYNKLVSLNVIN